MKRILVSLTMIAVFFWAAALPGADNEEPPQGGKAGDHGERPPRGKVGGHEERAPSGKVTIEATRVTIGIGYAWGEGTLKFKGKGYNFKVSGLNVVGLGVTKLQAKGDVYGLEKLDDFPGKYFGVGAGATVVKGTEGLVMKNSKGVVINLKADQKGAELKLGNEGLSISPTWD